MFIGGGIGYSYSEFIAIDRKRKNHELIEQGSVGIEFSLTKRIKVFIEDRFETVFSKGQVRAGVYILLNNDHPDDYEDDHRKYR